MASNTNTNASCNNIHTNFNPSWMQQTIPAKLTLPFNQQKSSADVEETCDPIFSKHSYGREDLLAMMEKLKMEAPTGLEKCPFFIKTPHTPVVLLPYTEIEMRLQQNINSSKALSAFNRTQGHSNIDLNTIETGIVTTAGQNRSGLGTNLAGQQRKYQPQENKQTTSRWSALATTGGNTMTAIRSTWKSATNIGITGNIERINIRDKAGLINQTERNEKIKNIQQEDEIPQNESNIHDISKESMHVENLKLVMPSTPPSRDRDLNDIIQQQSSMTQSEFIDSSQYLQKWCYLDPNGVQRGPFDSHQMQAWFTSGYFTASLQVQQVGDTNYISLGELFLINGENTPFINKKEQNIRQSKQIIDPNANINQSQKNQLELNEIISTKSTIGQNIQQRISPSVLLSASKPGNKLGLDVERIWAATPLEDVGIGTGSFGACNSNSNPQDSISTTGFAHSAFSQHLKEVELEKILQTREVQILEEQRKLRDKEELFRRDEKERIEKERRMQEMEAELKRKQDEFDRVAHEKDTEFEKRCIQMAEYERNKREELAALEQRILNEQHRQQLRMEEEDRRRAKEIQEILLREQERQRHFMEAEVTRKKEEEEARLRLSMQETQHMKELALEQAKRAKEEQRRRIIDEQQRQQQQALEETRADRIRQQEIATKAEAIAKAEQERMNTKKWQSISTQENSQQPTQPVIQSKKMQIPTLQQNQRSAWQTVPETGKPVQMSIPQSLPDKQDNMQQQYTATEPERERRGWQQVSVPKPTPIPPAITKNMGTITSGKQNTHTAQSKKNQQQKGAKTKTKQQANVVEDKLTEWICKRLKELNSSVDAEVFANFIAQIDSPNEAEDYIIGYLGDKKEVKDFHREFISKRIELRPRTQQIKKDDLSRPAAALNADIELTKGSTTSTSANQRSAIGGSGTNQNSNGGGANTKKKKQKKVLDASNLGFTAISNPNRVNAGEIDRVPPVIPGTNKKR